MKTCPHCKRSLELELIKNLYKPDMESSHINAPTARKLWYHRHKLFIYPMITLLIGGIIGGVLIYGYARASFASQKDGYEREISALGRVIDSLKQKDRSARSGFENQLAARDSLIDLLTRERNTMGRIIYFTRRMARNSTITPNSEAEVTRFQNNFKYLQKQFDGYQEELKTKNFKQHKSFNLKTLPMFLE